MLISTWKISPTATVATWKVEEDEAFFMEKTGLQATMKSERRRIEYLAGRFLLQHLQPGFPVSEIGKDEHEKPRLPGNRYFFSISHSWPYIAVVIDTATDAGIDIQTWHPKIIDIKHKFLAPREQDLFAHDLKLLTLAWSAKEAAYKWNGRRAVDFIEHLPVEQYDVKGDDHYVHINLYASNPANRIIILSTISADYTLSVVIPR